MTSPVQRAREVYAERGAREFLSRLFDQVSYQFTERIFGSRVWLRLRAFANGVRYETVDEPFELTSIDPDEIQYYSARGDSLGENVAQRRWQDIGRVMDGEWDVRSTSPEYAIENSLLYRAIEDHFERGVPWEETEYIEKSLERLHQGSHEDTWRAVVRNEADLWERCDQLDELYERIDEEGYNSKREVFASESDDPIGYYPRTYKYTLDEVMVDRARDGEPLLIDGKHRLFIAKILGVDEIPVLEVVTHEQYVNDH